MRIVAASFALAVTMLLGSVAPARAYVVPPQAQQTVAGARLAAVADRTVKSVRVDGDSEIVPAFTLVDQRVPAGATELVAQTPQVNPTYISVPVAIVVDGRVQRSVYAGYRVVHYVHTATAAHDLAPGTVLTRDDLALERIAANGRPAVEIDALLGRKLNVASAHGTPVYVEQTRINPLVSAGQSVLLTVRDGPVVLTVDVLARTGGGRGEQVALWNPRTNKALTGVVTDTGKAELVLPSDAEVSR